jgi:hypothetical protein
MKKFVLPSISLTGAAVIGFCLTPTLEIPHMRLFDALFSCLLAVVVWGGCHVIGAHDLSRGRMVAVGAISALTWALLVAGCMAALRRIDTNREHQHPQQLQTNVGPGSTKCSPSQPACFNGIYTARPALTRDPAMLHG